MSCTTCPRPSCSLLVSASCIIAPPKIGSIIIFFANLCNVEASCRWQEEEEDHRHQLSALRLAHEAQAGRLSQEEERSKAAEGEVARQKACIGGLRADAARLGDALHQAKAQVTGQPHAY